MSSRPCASLRKHIDPVSPPGRICSPALPSGHHEYSNHRAERNRAWPARQRSRPRTPLVICLHWAREKRANAGPPRGGHRPTGMHTRALPASVASEEVMHILAGAGRFEPEASDQPTVEFRAGDTLFFPPETRGVWDIRETVRKVYVMV